MAKKYGVQLIVRSSLNNKEGTVVKEVVKMEECVEGIILYVTPFKESSEILQVLTKEYGLIGLLCRGSKKVKSK